LKGLAGWLPNLTPPYDRSPARPRPRDPPVPGRPGGRWPRIPPPSTGPPRTPSGRSPCTAPPGAEPWPALFPAPGITAARSPIRLLTARTKRNRSVPNRPLDQFHRRSRRIGCSVPSSSVTSRAAVLYFSSYSGRAATQGRLRRQLFRWLCGIKSSAPSVSGYRNWETGCRRYATPFRERHLSSRVMRGQVPHCATTTSEPPSTAA